MTTTEQVDVVLVNGIVLTMNENGEIFSPGAVAVRGRDVVAVGPVEDVVDRYRAAETVDCRGQVVMPGLINAHTHVPMSLLRGLADDLRLDVWLYGYMLPVEREFVGPEFCHWGTLLSCIEMIQSGVTCFADMYYYEDEIAEAVAEVGMRAVLAESLMKLPTPDAPSYDAGLEYARHFIEDWKGHELIVPAVGPHSPYTCTVELLQAARAMALEHDVPLLIHLSETALEVEESRRATGQSPVAYAHGLGMLGGKVLAAHCVHIDEDEMALLAETGTGVASNPTSNLKLASGVADVRRMLELGVNVAVGTDGCSSNNDQDMFEETRLVALLAKGFSGSPLAVPARQAVAMATIGGARALHLAHLVGSLEPGKRADVTVIELHVPHNLPRFTLSADNVYSQLVYAAKSSDVRHVMVNGRWLMRDRRLLTVDVSSVIAEAQRIADRIKDFVIRREMSLLDKLVAIGSPTAREIFEVQVKAAIDDADALSARLLSHPALALTRRTERRQYDTYLLFADRSKGWIRYREDSLLENGEEVSPQYTLTLIGPTREREYENSVILSRSRYVAKADRSLRFYREYFQPDQVKEVVKYRRRVRANYKGVEFAFNVDMVSEPPRDEPYLEIKCRTWSEADALRKAQLIGELLEILGVSADNLLKREYIDF